MGVFCGEFFLKNGTPGSGLMAAWWYALMELTSVMLPLWCFGCHVGFFLGCWFEIGWRDASERCCFFLVIFSEIVWGFVFFWRICVFQNLHGSSFSEFTNCLGWGFGLRKERSHLAVDLLRNFSVLFSADLVISFRGHPNHAHSLCEQTYCGIVLQKTTGEEEMREGSACKILPSMRFRNNTPIEF